MLSLYPPEAYNEIGWVFTYGAKKYNPYNYRNGMAFSRLMNAAERHWNAWKAGEELDPESGKHHLAHLGCCVAMLLVYVSHPKLYMQFDDRFTKMVPAYSATEAPQSPPPSSEPHWFRRTCGLLKKHLLDNSSSETPPEAW